MIIKVKITKFEVVMAKHTALWMYFTTKEPTKEEAVAVILPKPDRLLSTSMPSSAIAAANSAVREYLLTTKGSITTPTSDDDEAQSSSTRGVYQVFSDAERAEFGRKWNCFSDAAFFQAGIWKASESTTETFAQYCAWLEGKVPRSTE